MAARRVSESLGLSIRHVVADARFLPFAAGAFDRAFSYSVIQHFSPEDAGSAVAEIGRTLKSGGSSKVQFPTVFGVRCLYQQVRRRFRNPVGFEVRYWTIPTLKALFSEAVGPNSISVDCFFGIGLQEADAPLMPIALRTLLALSKALRNASLVAPPLKYLADSVYVTAVKSNHTRDARGERQGLTNLLTRG
jgi:SAM-dependent methyltransferase